MNEDNQAARSVTLKLFPNSNSHETDMAFIAKILGSDGVSIPEVTECGESKYSCLFSYETEKGAWLRRDKLTTHLVELMLNNLIDSAEIDGDVISFDKAKFLEVPADNYKICFTPAGEPGYNYVISILRGIGITADFYADYKKVQDNIGAVGFNNLDKATLEQNLDLLRKELNYLITSGLVGGCWLGQWGEEAMVVEIKAKTEPKEITSKELFNMVCGHCQKPEEMFCSGMGGIGWCDTHSFTLPEHTYVDCSGINWADRVFGLREDAEDFEKTVKHRHDDVCFGDYKTSSARIKGYGVHYHKYD